MFHLTYAYLLLSFPLSRDLTARLCKAFEQKSIFARLHPVLLIETRGMKLAAIEGGGTTWVAVIAHESPENIVERADFKTELPEKTLGEIRDWLTKREFDAIGIATFGPVDAVESSPTYGYITSTPKPNWDNTGVFFVSKKSRLHCCSQTSLMLRTLFPLISRFLLLIMSCGIVDVLGLLGIRQFGKPFKFDTDVNAPALAEFLKNRELNASLSSSAYITIGTGVGVGLVVNGQTVHGLLHPEAGHIMVARQPGDDFEGTCPYHGACIEGLCSSGALAARKGED